MMDQVRSVIAASPPGTKLGAFEVATADDFCYTDPTDGSVAKNQGLRCAPPSSLAQSGAETRSGSPRGTAKHV